MFSLSFATELRWTVYSPVIINWELLASNRLSILDFNPDWVSQTCHHARLPYLDWTVVFKCDHVVADPETFLNVSKFSQNYANNLIKRNGGKCNLDLTGAVSSLCFPRKAVVHFRLQQIAVINQLKLFRLFLAISQRIVMIHNRHQWIQLLKVVSTIS